MGIKRKILPFGTYNEQDEMLAKKAAEKVKFQPCLQRTFILVRRQKRKSTIQHRKCMKYANSIQNYEKTPRIMTIPGLSRGEE